MALVRWDRDAATPELANTSAASIAWNVAATDTLPVVRFDPKARERSLDMLRWGLILYWAKDIKVGFANINAKAEGIENKPAFRKAFLSGRVPRRPRRSLGSAPSCCRSLAAENGNKPLTPRRRNRA